MGAWVMSDKKCCRVVAACFVATVVYWKRADGDIGTDVLVFVINTEASEQNYTD
jgi:hypothetical protein